MTARLGRFLGLGLGIGLACTLATPALAASDKDERNLVISAPAGTSVATAPKRVALVIGNGAYRDAPLNNPSNDARAMAEALKESGFTVSLQVDTDIQGTRVRHFRAIWRPLRDPRSIQINDLQSQKQPFLNFLVVPIRDSLVVSFP